MAAEKEEISAEHVNPVFVKLCNKGKINLEKRENSVKMHRKLNRSPSKCVYTLPDQLIFQQTAQQQKACTFYSV